MGEVKENLKKKIKNYDDRTILKRVDQSNISFHSLGTMFTSCAA